LASKSTAEPDPLLLTAGEVRWFAIRKLADPESVEEVPRLIPSRLPVYAASPQRVRHSVYCGHVWPQPVVLEDNGDITSFGRVCAVRSRDLARS
jgi:hypothetical protein